MAYSAERPSRFKNCMYTAGYGFGIGAALGTTVGVLFSGLSVLGPRYKGHRLAMMAKTCAQSGTMFGTFLAVGSIIRGC